MQRELYPPIEPYDQGFLPVSSLHTLYYEQCGNPEGKPVVFLHGGPGGGIEPLYRQYFDPRRWRVVLFDQRGCGRSRPYAELRENTTWDLVADIEKLRQHLGIERWFVFGGSWGSALALAYGQTHPNSCLGFILRGIFLLRSFEIRWFYQEGASYLFPDAWQHYLEPIPPEERGDLLAAYYRRLNDPNPQVRLKAARAWAIWEASTSKLIPSPEPPASRHRPGALRRRLPSPFRLGATSGLARGRVSPDPRCWPFHYRAWDPHRPPGGHRSLCPALRTAAKRACRCLAASLSLTQTEGLQDLRSSSGHCPHK
jgi:pimeloyl-ACP methyl ester carboxylesterase